MESPNNLSKGYGRVNNLPNDDASIQNPKTAKKRNVTVVISLTLILTLIVGALIGALIHETASESHPSKHQFSPSPSPQPSPDSVESVRLVCSVTPHPESCIAAVSSMEGRETPRPDPVHIFNLSLQATFLEVKRVSSLPAKLITTAAGKDSGTKAALEDCMALFDDALSELGRSMEELGVGPGERVVLTEEKIGDMQTWISAAMTDEEGCVDGLEEMESGLAEEVKASLVIPKAYMANSLAIINNMEGLVQQFGLTMH